MSINLDTSKVQSNALPNLTKAKDCIQGIYDLSTTLKSKMPSTTMYKKYANDLPNKINIIKNDINSTSKKIDEKLKNIKKIESKNKSSFKALLLDEELFNNSKSMKVTNVKSAVNVKTSDSSETGAKTTNKFTSFFKGLFGGIKDVGVAVGNWFKTLFSKKEETEETEFSLGNIDEMQLTQEEQEKAKEIQLYLEKYKEEMYYLELQNCEDFSVNSQYNLTKEEAEAVGQIIHLTSAASVYNETFYSYEKVREFFKGTRAEDEINWELVKSVYDKGFNIYEVILQDQSLLEEFYLKSASVSTGEKKIQDIIHLLSFMTEEERKTVLYIYNTEGEEAVNEYLNFKIPEVNNRAGLYRAELFLEELNACETEEQYQKVIQKGLPDGIVNHIEGLENALGGMDGITSEHQWEMMYILMGLSDGQINSLTDDPTVLNTIKGLKSDLLTGTYEISLGIGNMLPAMAASYISSLAITPVGGKIVGSVLMGLSAGGNAAESAYQQGYGYYESIFYGTLSGASETVLGYFLGSIPGLSAIDNAPGLKGYLLGIFKEGGEEFLQAVLDPFLQSMALGIDYDLDPDELLKSGIYGIIISAILNGGTITINGNVLNVESITTETIELVALAEKLGVEVDYNEVLIEGNTELFFDEIINVLDESTNISVQEKIDYAKKLLKTGGNKYFNKASVDVAFNNVHICATRAEFEKQYKACGGKGDPKTIGGFHDRSTGKIYLPPNVSVSTVIHEVIHRLGRTSNGNLYQRSINEAFTEYLAYNMTGKWNTNCSYNYNAMAIEKLDLLYKKYYNSNITFADAYFGSDYTFNRLVNDINKIGGNIIVNNKSIPFYDYLALQFDISDNARGKYTKQERDAARDEIDRLVEKFEQNLKIMKAKGAI